MFSENLDVSKKYATIMFDDGYKDNIAVAVPILKKYNCKASFYIVTDCITKNIPTWTHILEHTFQHTTISEINIDFDFLPASLRVKKLNSLKERLIYVSKLKPFLKTISHEKRNIVIDIITQSYSDVSFPKLMMNWEDVRELKKEGHCIGSHTLSHCMLGTMSDENEIETELDESKKIIENEIGCCPLTISYPVGSYNKVVIEKSKKVGYKLGLAVKQKIFNPALDDIFEIPRIELYNEPWLKTKLRINNTLESIKSIIRYK